jgi:hypothetical protein
MAYAIQATIGAGNKVSLNYQSQEVNVSLTYQLERQDTDVLHVIQEKAEEVARAHQAAWQRIHDVKVEGNAENRQKSPASDPPSAGATAPGAGEAALEAQAAASTAADEVATAGQQAALRALLTHTGVSDEQVREKLQADFSCSGIEELTRQQASQWLLQLQRREREQAQQRRLQAAHLNGKQDSP